MIPQYLTDHQAIVVMLCGTVAWLFKHAIDAGRHMERYRRLVTRVKRLERLSGIEDNGDEHK